MNVEDRSNSFPLFGYDLTVFIAGFCVMVLELTAGRLISRYVGSSLNTWTGVIGIILAGITLGNFLGGKAADRSNNRQRFVGILFLAAALFSSLTMLIQEFLMKTRFFDVMPFTMYVFLHILIMFFVPSLLLGMVSPIVAKSALDKNLAPGRTMGSIYAWSAIGSIAGTFLTGYVFMAFMGTRSIIWSVAGILCITGVIYLSKSGPLRASRENISV